MLTRLLSSSGISAYDAQTLLQEKFQLTCSLSTRYKIMHSAGLSWISGRSGHPQQRVEVQEAFKKNSLKTWRTIFFPVFYPATSMFVFKMRLLSDNEILSEWLREHELCNRCLESYEDIVDACCNAWNKLTAETDRIASLCYRRWAVIE